MGVCFALGCNSQSPKFDLDCLKTMVKHCPNLKELRLSQVGQLEDDWLPIIAQLKHLTSLDLSRVGKDYISPLTDESVIDLLSKIGENLIHLDLSRHVELTEAVLMEGIAQYCPNLESLTLNGMAGNPDNNKSTATGFSDDGMAAFFKAWTEAGHNGLKRIELAECHLLASASLNALVDHSSSTLESLNIAGWKDVEAEALTNLGQQCGQLKSVNLSWCRNLTDFAVKDVLDGTQVKKLEVWGELDGSSA